MKRRQMTWAIVFAFILSQVLLFTSCNASRSPADPSGQAPGNNSQTEESAAPAPETTAPQEIKYPIPEDGLRFIRENAGAVLENILRENYPWKDAASPEDCDISVIETAVSADDRKTEDQRGRDSGDQIWAFHISVLFVPKNEISVNMANAANTSPLSTLEKEIISSTQPLFSSDLQSYPDGFLFSRVGYLTFENSEWMLSPLSTGW